MGTTETDAVTTQLADAEAILHLLGSGHFGEWTPERLMFALATAAGLTLGDLLDGETSTTWRYRLCDMAAFALGNASRVRQRDPKGALHGR